MPWSQTSWAQNPSFALSGHVTFSKLLNFCVPSQSPCVKMVIVKMK